MSRGKAYRREKDQKYKNKARRYAERFIFDKELTEASNVRAESYGFDEVQDREEQIEYWTNRNYKQHKKSCSCSMCGNIRNHLGNNVGAKTLKEMKEDEKEKDRKKE